jgi:hypothetical protein
MESTTRVRAALEDLQLLLAIRLESLADLLWGRLVSRDRDVSRTFESGDIVAVAHVSVVDGEVESSIELEVRKVTVRELPPLDQLTIDQFSLRELYDAMNAYHLALAWVERF